jgi:hypothetical protein
MATVQIKGGKMEYYRNNNVNPNWYDIFIEQIEDGESYEDVLDQLAELACGIKMGASDTCQSYARHIRTHIEAAFRVGVKTAEKIKKDIKGGKEIE